MAKKKKEVEKEVAEAPKKVFYLDHTRRTKTAVAPKFKPVGGLNEDIEKVKFQEYLDSPYSATIVEDGAPEGFTVPAKKK